MGQARGVRGASACAAVADRRSPDRRAGGPRRRRRLARAASVAGVARRALGRARRLQGGLWLRGGLVRLLGVVRLGVVAGGAVCRFGGLRGGCRRCGLERRRRRRGRGPRPGRIALGDRLEQQDRAGDCGVERPDPTLHRDPHEQVAAAADRRSQALTLAADDDRQRSAQVRLARGQRRVGLGSGDPQAVGVQVGQGARQVVDRAQEEMLGRSGRCLDRGRRRAAPAAGSGRRRRGRRPPRRCEAGCRRSADPRANRGRARTAARRAPRPGRGRRRSMANRRGSTTSATPWWPSKPAMAVSEPPSTSTIGMRRRVAWRTSCSRALRRCGTTSRRWATRPAANTSSTGRRPATSSSSGPSSSGAGMDSARRGQASAGPGRDGRGHGSRGAAGRSCGPGGPVGRSRNAGRHGPRSGGGPPRLGGRHGPRSGGGPPGGRHEPRSGGGPPGRGVNGRSPAGPGRGACGSDPRAAGSGRSPRGRASGRSEPVHGAGRGLPVPGPGPPPWRPRSASHGGRPAPGPPGGLTATVGRPAIGGWPTARGSVLPSPVRTAGPSLR